LQNLLSPRVDATIPARAYARLVPKKGRSPNARQCDRYLPPVRPPPPLIADPRRHQRRAVWIDPVVFRAITIPWNNIIIPVRPYHGRDDKPLPWWFTDDSGRPRLSCATKRPQATQHQGRSESQRCGHCPHASASLPRRQINELKRLVQVQLVRLKSDGRGRRDRGALIAGHR